MKLQKQLSRKVGDVEYVKWVLTIPPKIVKQLDWNAGLDLQAKPTKDGLMLLRKVKR